MNKRLIALFLCLVMMLSVFLTGCAESSEEDAKNELAEAKVASNMTLTMWIVSETPVSESIRADVTKAINVLTKAKYKTQLEIYYLSEEEYFEKLTAAMEAYDETKKAQNANKPAETGTTNGEETGTTIEEIVTDEHGMYRDNYPIVLENQVDIIYIGDLKDGNGNLLMSGQQMYNELRADDWLASLDEAIKGDAKKLKEFVSPTLLSAVQEKGVTYAIPNNNVIGEYTFMCLNKTLMDRYSLQGHLTRGSIKSFANEYVYQFIDQISRYENAVTVEGGDAKDLLLPIDATYEECLAQLAYYWNIDPEDYSIASEEFSIFGTPLFNTHPSRGENAVGVESLFENEEFTEHYLALNEYRLGEKYGFYKDGENWVESTDKVVFFRDEDNKDVEYGSYGIKFVKGTLAELNAKGNYVDENGVEYYAIPVAYPTATAEDIYGNMFAVAKTTLNVDRSMQIVTYLNTNTEIRNLLQYGIQGQHYTIENGVVARVADKNNNYYVMDIYATGNAFLAHLEPGMSASIWENGKEQNRDSLVEPLLGFNLAEYADAATQFGIPIEVTNTKTYSTTFRTGLNKSVFANDAVLGAWIEECDAKEPGVYVFRSREKTLNNEYSEVLYFYNTTGAYRFGVESEEVPKESGTGYYRNNTYTYTEDSSLFGSYTLTMVYDICMVRYEGTYKVVQKTLDKDGETEVSRTEQAYTETFTYTDKRYDFDLYETDSYKLNVYGDLYLADFYDNKAIFDKLVELCNDEKTAKGKVNLGFYWQDTTSSETKNYYSFVLYRKNTTHTTQIDIVPVLSGNQIKLVVNYDEYMTSEIKDPENYGIEPGVRPGKRYMLYYVTVETDKNVKNVSVSYNYSQTTQAELENGPLVQEYIKDAATTIAMQEIGIDTPVNFHPHGMLNTEMIKYMAELNSIAVELLNSCQTPAELEKMVGYLSLLFNTEDELVSLYKNYPELDVNSPADRVDEKFLSFVNNPDSIVYKDNFKELFYQLTHITNYGTMEEVLGNLLTILEIKDEYRPIFYSPYGIYYLWMEAYQYLPADMQTAQ